MHYFRGKLGPQTRGLMACPRRVLTDAPANRSAGPSRFVRKTCGSCRASPHWADRQPPVRAPTPTNVVYLTAMSSVPQTQPPSPELVFDTLNAYQRSAALKAAIQLDVFTAIGEGNATAQTIAGRCQTSERGMRILCDFLAIC